MPQIEPKPQTLTLTPRFRKPCLWFIFAGASRLFQPGEDDGDQRLHASSEDASSAYGEFPKKEAVKGLGFRVWGLRV